MIEQMIKQISK